MTNSQRDRSLGDGVFYSAQDYVGFSRRLAILLIDGVVLLTISLVLAGLFGAFEEGLSEQLFIVWLLSFWTYDSVLKPSPVRTIGYRVMGCRVVNLKGQRPSILRMTFRSLLWVLGPFNLLFDLLWCGIDDDYQALRDRFAGTCVIKQHAKPIGTGPIHLARFSAMGYAYVYPRVTRPHLDKVPAAT